MTQIRLNAYHIMHLIVMFDLPVRTKPQRKAAADFRRGLERDGFAMLQYSVYIRMASSWEAAETHIRRLRRIMPPEGSTRILTITDKQLSRMVNVYGAIEEKNKPTQPQLEFF